jgi:hypothetical protein
MVIESKLPQEIEAEESILVSIFLDSTCRDKIFSSLSDDDFYASRNKIVFEKCKELRGSGGEIDLSILYEGLNEKERATVKVSWLSSLVDTVPLAVDPEFYIGKIKDAAYRRRAIELANAIQKKAFNGDIGAIERLASGIIDASKTKDATGISDGILTFKEVAELDIPKKQIYLDPWLTEQSITLISGWRGTGKTWLAMSIADAISKGQSFGHWPTETPVPVLYLDAEMPISDMKYRTQQLGIGLNCKAPIFLYSSSYTSTLGLPRANLLNENWRNQIKSLLIDKEIKLWFVDNIATLAQGINENAKEDWDPINEFFLSLRFAGIATVMLHHVSKAGLQRGTSAREDNIDNSIILSRPGDYETEQGCRFKMTFEKNRVVCGDHFLLAAQELQYSNGVWTFDDFKEKTSTRILEMLKAGNKQKDIASELGVSAAYVSKVKKENECSLSGQFSS